MATSSVGEEVVSRSQSIEEGFHGHYVGQSRQLSCPWVLLVATVQSGTSEGRARG